MQVQAARWLLLLVLVVLATGLVSAQERFPKPNPAEVGLSPERLQRIHALLQGHVDQKLIAGGVALIARHGKLAYLDSAGVRDREAGKPMTPDTIFRIASMTKPVTSVAVMMLVDEGRIKLDDPLSKYVPEFKSMTVLRRKDDGTYERVPAEREITVHNLLTHTAGISYGFFGKEHISDLYKKANISDGLTQTEGTIGDNAQRLARLPLLHQPGSTWEYGLNTDVLGRVIEVASGMTLDQFCQKRIFEPLKMPDTHFFLPTEKRDRLAAVYTPGEDKTITRVGDKPVTTGPVTYSASFHYLGPRTYFSGGAGLVSTASDYARFLQMLLNRGELDGVRLLKPETVDQMTRNQIGDLKNAFSPHGDKFGYGFGVVTEAAKGKDPASAGTYYWGGFFNTLFFVDPEKKMVAVLLTQLYPSNHLKLRDEFKRLVYEALAE
jgi:CubicO group peptidase (beta-lactamase class C family)